VLFDYPNEKAQEEVGTGTYPLHSIISCLSVASQLAAIERRLSVTNLSSENNFADVSTECSSRQSYFPNSNW